MFAENAARTPFASPSTSSVEPPPRSTTTKGAPAASSSPTAPANDNRASSSPVMTSATEPGTMGSRIARVIAKKSSRFDASRVADVATIRSADAPLSRILPAYSSSATRVRSIASGAKEPVASTPCPRRTTRISRTTSVSTPSLISAINSLIELVPQSMAATRVMKSLREVQRWWASRPELQCRATMFQRRAPPTRHRAG